MKTDKNQKLTAIISTIRHGEKDEDGKLTKIGKYQGALKGSETQFLKEDVLLFHSGVDRVKDTLLSFANHLHLKNKGQLVELEDKNRNFQDYTSHYLHYLYDPKVKGKLFGKWDLQENINQNERMQLFLNQKDKSSEFKVYPSPKLMAVRLARIIATQIDFATITIPEITTNFVNGTHEPVLMSFLYYFLQDYKPKNKNFVKDIGGTVQFSEGFEIYIYQNLAKENKVIFIFRNIKKEIDQEKLKEFCLSEKVA